MILAQQKETYERDYNKQKKERFKKVSFNKEKEDLQSF